MSTSRDGEESNLEKLLKAIDGEGYSKRRKLLDSEQKDEDQISDSELLSDPVDGDECDVPLKLTPDLSSEDRYDSYNETYERYLDSNREQEEEALFTHPLYSPYRLTVVTPLLKYLLALEDVPDPVQDPERYFIPKPVVKAMQALGKSKRKTEVPPRSKSVKYLFECMNTYVDVFYSNNSIRVLESVRFMYSLHIANHIVRSSLRRKEAKEDHRTEGFTRPKVLVICGLRCIAYEVVRNILALIPCSKSSEKLERFESDFSLSQEDLDEQNGSFLKTKKAEDFIRTFSGNQDDAFKMGIRYESGLLHLYSPFYSSDVVVASPLGLRPLIASKEPDYDFLSSVEVVVVDRLDIIKFQNWRLFTDLFKVLNRPLLRWRDGDINRIRMSFVDGQAEEYRQTILVSAARNAIFNSFFKNLKNRRGSVRLFRPVKNEYVLLASKFKVQQMFIKVPCSDVKKAQEDCLDYFMENMIPNLDEVNGVLVVLQDYTQYFRLSKKLKYSNLEFLPCHEANTPKQMKLARQKFHAKEVPILVTTFRLLYFKRYLFKGSSKIFLMHPPEYPQLYKDFPRMVDTSRSNMIVCYYTKYHAMYLEPVVGTHRVAKLAEAPDTKITQFL